MATSGGAVAVEPMPPGTALVPVGVTMWQQLIRDLDLPRETRWIAMMLSTYADWESGTSARPSQRVLSQKAGVHTSTVRRHLAALRTLGLIDRTTRGSNIGKRNASDVYRLVYPADAASRLPRNQGAGLALT